jgi:hypothetical protein
MKYAKEALASHNSVAEVEGLCEAAFRLHRHGMSDVDVVLADVYSLGVADVVRILREHKGVEAILNVHPYGQYSADAKARAADAGAGLFSYKELFGALRHKGSDFIGYVPRGDS